MKALKFLISGATLASLLTIGALATDAHSFPEQEIPAAGQTLNAPPPEIAIKFDAPIEKLFAKLEVVGPDGQNLATGAPEVGSDGYTLSIKVPPLKPGDYLVKWGVVCVDTHHTEGSFPFTVASSGS